MLWKLRQTTPSRLTCQIRILWHDVAVFRADHGQKHDPGDEMITRSDLTSKGPLQKHYSCIFFKVGVSGCGLMGPSEY